MVMLWLAVMVIPLIHSLTTTTHPTVEPTVEPTETLTMASAGWQIQDTTMPRATYRMAIGYSNRSVHLLGVYSASAQ